MILLVAWILVLVLVPPAAAIPFDADFEFHATAIGPRGVALGDVDGDGSIDAVTTDVSPASHGAISVLRGAGDGGFAAAVALPATAAADLALGQFDADANLDLVRGSSGRIEIWRGDGAGGFTLVRSINTDPSAVIWRVWVARMDGDARADVVVFEVESHGAWGHVGVLRGAGDADFAAPQWTAPVAAAFDAAIGDVDADGVLDVVMSHAGELGIELRFGAGDGSFGPASTLPLAGAPWGVALADLDATPGAEIAAYYSVVQFGVPLHRIAVWRWEGSGSARLTDAFVEGIVVRIHAADLDLDGDDDLIAIGARLGILRGDGDGALQPARPYEAGRGPWSAATTDLDGDGHTDIVVAALDSNGIAVLRGGEDFAWGTGRRVFTAPQPQAIVAADFDADGRVDLALTSPVADAVAVHRGLAAANFTSRTEWPVAPEPAGLGCGDVDGDHQLDLVCASFDPAGPNAVTVRRGSGNLQFGPRADVALPGPATAVAVADLDADGDDDVVATLWTRDYPEDGEVVVLRSRGDGDFDPPVFYDAGPLPWSVSIRDVNEDGITDLLVPFRAASGAGAGGVTLLHGAGGAVFGGRHDVLTGIEPRAVATGDFDADGHVDLAVTNSAFSTFEPPDVLILRGDGAGNWTEHVRCELGLEPQAIVSADFDADGKLDLAVANSGANTVSVLRGRGDGGFEPRTDFGSGTRTRMLATADLDGDQRPDLVVTNEYASGAGILLNRSAITPVVFDALSARRTAAGVVLAWHWSAGWEAVQVERATAAAGPYAVLAVVRREAAPEYVDALPGIETAWYRLRALPSAATSAPFMVEAAVGNSRLRFARERAGLLVIGMSLVAPASRLAIHDVLGREVASLPVHGLGRGDHVLEWEPRTRDGARLARGVYWARLEAGGVVTSLRFLRLQP